MCLGANEVMSNGRREASGKQIVGQTSSFFSRIIKLADEGNTLDIMNLAFSRALDRGLHEFWLNSSHSGLEGSWHGWDPPQRASTPWGTRDGCCSGDIGARPCLGGLIQSSQPLAKERSSSSFQGLKCCLRRGQMERTARLVGDRRP